MRLLSSLLILFLATSAQALVLDTQLADMQQEREAQILFHELRCIVCEGQSLAESDAMFAQQMRSEIRRKLESGENSEAVKDYFVTRYGAQILQTPPLMPATYLLWAMPILFLLGAAWLLRPRRKGDPS